MILAGLHTGFFVLKNLRNRSVSYLCLCARAICVNVDEVFINSFALLPKPDGKYNPVFSKRSAMGKRDALYSPSFLNAVRGE